MAQWPIKRLDRPGLIQRILFDVTDHACDFPHYTREKCQCDVLANRILDRPETLRHGFTDEDHGRPARHIGVVQVTASQHRDVHCTQVAGRDQANIYLRLIRHRYEGLAFDRDGLVRAAIIHRQTIDQAG